MDAIAMSEMTTYFPVNEMYKMHDLGIDYDVRSSGLKSSDEGL